MALRYFKEKLPALHVIGAGSLLEFALIQGKFSFPVGRIQFMYLNPLSFQEYVQARGKSKEFEQLKKCTPNTPPKISVHTNMLNLVREYFFIGGMPAAVSNFCQTLSFEEPSRIHEVLLSTYQADFSKYATPSGQKYLKILFQGIFPLITQQFKYSKIDAHIRSRELKEALDHLQWAGLIHLIHTSSASGIPLSSQITTRFKSLFLDIGLVQHALKIDPQIILDKDLIQINRGAIAEQFVGQELLAYTSPYEHEELYYWEREKKGSAAEIDYLYIMRGNILPIEVKAGPHGRLKSLRTFMKEKKSLLGIRISEKSLCYEEGILSVPFYAISLLPHYLQAVL